MKGLLPSAPEVAREVVVVLVGALVASLIVRGLPLEWRRLFSWPAADQ